MKQSLKDGLPVKRAKYLFNILNGSTPASGEAEFWDGEIPWATPEDIGKLQSSTLRSTRRNITELGYQSCGAHLAPAGSIIMTTRAPVGNLALSGISICTNQGCKTLVSRDEALDSRYFYYQLLTQTEELNVRATGTTFLELGTEELCDFPLFNPMPKEQVAIANFLDRETARLDALVAEKERWLELLAEKRRALITRGVTRGLNTSAPRRDSSISWLGKIPEHWQVKRSKWLFNERDERTENDEGEMLTVSHITGVTPRSEKDVNMFEAETTEGYKICKKGDLAINTLWAWMGAMGVSPCEGIVSPAYNVYAIGPELVTGYVEALVRMPLFAQEIIRYSKGVWSSRLRLYPEGFFEAWLPVPPLSEQRAIVAHITAETAKLDALRAATEKTIGLLKERRAALIAAAVTGKLAIT